MAIDPISATLQAIGPALEQQVKAVRQGMDYIWGPEKARKLAALNTPDFKWFGRYEGRQDNSLWLVLILAGLTVILVVAVAYQNRN